MKITADTNVLVRAVVRDDPKQTVAAVALLRDAELIALPLPCLCELAWVLRSVYGFDKSEIALAIEALLQASNIAVDALGAEAGLQVLRAGGDFADGAIAYGGRWMGGKTFVSFDKKAVALILKQGHAARLLE
jgi:predicted nucleic-acid-binding protein